MNERLRKTVVKYLIILSIAVAYLIVKLDFAAAFAYNPFLMIAGPVIIAYLVFSEIKYIKTGSPSMGKWEILLWVLGGAAIAFGIIRNII